MKVQVPGSFVLFSIAFVLVGMVTTIELPCPLSHGTGIIAAAQDLRAESIKSELISMKKTFRFTACGTAVPSIKYTYAVDMLLTNESTEPRQGSVLISFNPRFGMGQHLVLEGGGGEDPILVEGPAPSVLLPTYVDVPAGGTENVERVLSFIDDAYNIPSGVQADPHGVTVEEGNDIPDPTCSETGKVPFVKWLEVKILGMVLK